MSSIHSYLRKMQGGEREQRIDHAIDSLAKAVLACAEKNDAQVRIELKLAAEKLGLFLDVPASGPCSFRLIQEYALTAAKALCTVRAPPALRPEHALDAATRAEAAITAAWEVACGRRAA